MRLRFQLPADFRLWRVGCLLAALALLWLGLRFLALAGKQGAYLEAVGPAILGFSFFVGSGICVGIGFSGTLSLPLLRVFDHLFYPTETLRQPPKELLSSLRMRLRDRYWESVDQQTRELINAYGPSPELYHLRALLEGGRSGSPSAATVEASKKLSARAFDRYTALLQRDPPPREIQTGIEA